MPIIKVIDKETDVKVDIGFNQLSGVKSVKLIKVRTLPLQLLLLNVLYAGLFGGCRLISYTHIGLICFLFADRRVKRGYFCEVVDQASLTCSVIIEFSTYSYCSSAHNTG